jgi:hypothetical protein
MEYIEHIKDQDIETLTKYMLLTSKNTPMFHAIKAAIAVHNSVFIA